MVFNSVQLKLKAVGLHLTQQKEKYVFRVICKSQCAITISPWPSISLGRPGCTVKPSWKVAARRWPEKELGLWDIVYDLLSIKTTVCECKGQPMNLYFCHLGCVFPFSRSIQGRWPLNKLAYIGTRTYYFITTTSNVHVVLSLNILSCHCRLHTFALAPITVICCWKWEPPPVYESLQVGMSAVL